MKLAIERLYRELTETQDLINDYEARRDKVARGSASYRCIDSEVQFYRGKAHGIRIAIQAIYSTNAE